MSRSHEKKYPGARFHTASKSWQEPKRMELLLFLSSTNLTRPQFESKVSTDSNDNSLSSKHMHHHAHWGILHLSTTPEGRRGEREGGEKERRRGRRKGKRKKRWEEEKKGGREGGTRGTERRGKDRGKETEQEEDEGREGREEEEEGRRRREGEGRGERGNEGEERGVHVHAQLLMLHSPLPLSLPDGDWHEAAPKSVHH